MVINWKIPYVDRRDNKVNHHIKKGEKNQNCKQKDKAAYISNWEDIAMLSQAISFMSTLFKTDQYRALNGHGWQSWYDWWLIRHDDLVKASGSDICLSFVFVDSSGKTRRVGRRQCDIHLRYDMAEFARRQFKKRRLLLTGRISHCFQKETCYAEFSRRKKFSERHEWY